MNNWKWRLLMVAINTSCALLCWRNGRDWLMYANTFAAGFNVFAWAVHIWVSRRRSS